MKDNMAISPSVGLTPTPLKTEEKKVPLFILFLAWGLRYGTLGKLRKSHVTRIFEEQPSLMTI